MPRSADRLIARACMATAIVWAASLPLAAYTAGHETGVPTSFTGAAVYGIGAVVCHQQPDRSFKWAGVSWPVCARCTGIYLGAAAVALVGLVSRGLRPRVFTSAGGARLALAVAVLPSLATLVYEWTTGVTPGNVTRLIAGLPIGAGVIAAIGAAAGPPAGSGPKSVR